MQNMVANSAIKIDLVIDEANNDETTKIANTGN